MKILSVNYRPVVYNGKPDGYAVYLRVKVGRGHEDRWVGDKRDRQDAKETAEAQAEESGGVPVEWIPDPAIVGEV